MHGLAGSTPVDRWARLSQTPMVRLRSHRSGWQHAEFQEIEVPAQGTFSGASESIHVTATCGPMTLRYGGHRNHFERVPPFAHMNLPGYCQDGAWQGRQRGLHLFIDPRLIEAHTHQPFRRGNYRVQPLHEPVVRSLMNALHCDVKHGSRSGPALGESIIDAIIGMFEVGGQESKKPTPERLDRVLELIEAEIGRPLSLARLAEECGGSVRHMSRRFREVTGSSPHQYIVRRRVDRARELIEHGSLDLVEIADRVGFSSQAHLSSTMKRLTGVTPSQLRRPGRG